LKKLTKELKEILNIQPIKNVIVALAADLPKDQNLLVVTTVVEKVKSDQIKVFLLFNKLALNAVAMEKQ
jgi:hypothetical protein